MRAVVFKKSLPITDREALVDVELPRPQPGGRDLLVKVEAVSVNPVWGHARAWMGCGGDGGGGRR
jgi:NADPH:quinone reductase-like Zn-dependent oxidoreductase